MNLFKKLYQYRYVAIRRYGSKLWTVESGQIEINPSYLVSFGECEKTELRDGDCVPYIAELSNGTRFLCYFRDPELSDGVVSRMGESANELAGDLTEFVRRKIWALNK